jgi:peptidylprolyl isomerase
MRVRTLVVCGLLIASCSKDEPVPASAPSSKVKPHARIVEADQRPAIGHATPRPSLPESSDANPPGVPRLDGPIQTDRGVDYIDEVVGTGALPEKGKTIKAHYTGWLTDGTKFDSSVDRDEPIRVRFDSGQVIKGWDIGLATMRVGGKRRVIVPAELGYGDGGAHGKIPPGATLVFDIELLDAGD